MNKKKAKSVTKDSPEVKQPAPERIFREADFRERVKNAK